MSIPDEVGSVYDCGFVSPTFGNLGMSLKPYTYHREQQLLKRQDVIAALQAAIADRDLAFWTRVSQFDWSKGQNQQLFTDPSRYADSRGIDIHTLGRLALVPQPTVQASVAAEMRGRGAGICTTILPNGAVAMFFPWTDGNYVYSVNGGASWATSTTPATGRISDIVTQGNQVFFAFYNVGGVWSTLASGPGALTQYDSGGNRYGKLVLDPIRKTLFGIRCADQGADFHKINAGAVPTIIFDFVQGRLDALELYQGNPVVSWNQAAYTRGAGPSRLYTFSGTLVAATVPTAFADLPDGVFVTGLRAYLGFLFVATMESDPFAPTVDKAALYYMQGTTGPTRVDQVDALYADDINAAVFLGYPYFMFGQGTQLFLCTQSRVTRYDIASGGVSRSLGDDNIGTLTGRLMGAVVARGAIYGIVGMIAGTLIGVVLLNPAGAAGLISTSGTLGTQLVSSRFDLGLPYVEKFWYAFEVVCDPLPVGGQIAMEYSLDDGVTWTACGGSPLTTVGTKRFNFLIQRVNASVRYRVTLIDASGASAGPVIHDIAARFTPGNPNAKMWTFTVIAQDNIRLRNNKPSDVSGQDIQAFLFNVSQQSEVVTFYDANEPLLAGGGRPPHNVWVMSNAEDSANTGGTYNPLRQEGDVAVTLWEVT